MKNQNKTEVTRLTPIEKEFIEYTRSLQQSSTAKINVKYIERTYNEGDLYFILPDAHYPYQNEGLMEKVRHCISDNPPKGVVIAGDWLDLFTLGSYNAESLGLLRDITLSEEYEAGLKGIEDLETVLPLEAEKMFLYGNHCDRYFRELYKKDNSKYGFELQNPIDALKLKEFGYQVKTNWKDDYFTVGDLDIMHGVYHNIHVAKKHLEMHGRSVMFGHTHRVQTHFTAHEAAFNIGTLADINNKAFGYMPRMQRENWSNGFAAINVIEGRSYVTMITVRSGKFIFNGKIY